MRIAVRGALRPARPGVTVAAGDFNATRDHRRLREIMGEGLREATAGARPSPPATWPADVPLLPPLVRPDHVLVSAAVEVRRVAEPAGPGSDHRMVVADLVLPA